MEVPAFGLLRRREHFFQRLVKTHESPGIQPLRLGGTNPAVKTQRPLRSPGTAFGIGAEAGQQFARTGIVFGKIAAHQRLGRLPGVEHQRRKHIGPHIVERHVIAAAAVQEHPADAPVAVEPQPFGHPFQHGKGRQVVVEILDIVPDIDLSGNVPPAVETPGEFLPPRRPEGVGREGQVHGADDHPRIGGHRHRRRLQRREIPQRKELMVRETPGQPREQPHYGGRCAFGRISRGGAGRTTADGVVVGRSDHEPQRSGVALPEIIGDIRLDAAVSLLGREAELTVVTLPIDQGVNGFGTAGQHPAQLVSPESPAGLDVVRRENARAVGVMRRGGVKSPEPECETAAGIAQSDRRGRQVRSLDARVLVRQRLHQLVLQPQHPPSVACREAHAPASAFHAEIGPEQRIHGDRKGEQLPAALPANRPLPAVGTPPQVVAEILRPAEVLPREVVGRQHHIAVARRGRHARRGASDPLEQTAQGRGGDERQPFKTRYTAAHKCYTCSGNGSGSCRNPCVSPCNRCTKCPAVRS